MTETIPCLTFQLCSAPSRASTPHARRTSLRPGLLALLGGKCKVLCLVEEETEGQGGAVTRPRAQPGQQRAQSWAPRLLASLLFLSHSTLRSRKKSLCSETEQKSFLQTKQPGVCSAHSTPAPHLASDLHHSTQPSQPPSKKETCFHSTDEETEGPSGSAA